MNIKICSTFKHIQNMIITDSTGAKCISAYDLYRYLSKSNVVAAFERAEILSPDYPTNPKIVKEIKSKIFALRNYIRDYVFHPRMGFAYKYVKAGIITCYLDIYILLDEGSLFNPSNVLNDEDPASVEDLTITLRPLNVNRWYRDEDEDIVYTANPEEDLHLIYSAFRSYASFIVAESDPTLKAQYEEYKEAKKLQKAKEEKEQHEKLCASYPDFREYKKITPFAAYFMPWEDGRAFSDHDYYEYITLEDFVKMVGNSEVMDSYRSLLANKFLYSEEVIAELVKRLTKLADYCKKNYLSEKALSKLISDGVIQNKGELTIRVSHNCLLFPEGCCELRQLDFCNRISDDICVPAASLLREEHYGLYSQVIKSNMQELKTWIYSRDGNDVEESDVEESDVEESDVEESDVEESDVEESDVESSSNDVETRVFYACEEIDLDSILAESTYKPSRPFSDSFCVSLGKSNGFVQDYHRYFTPMVKFAEFMDNAETGESFTKYLCEQCPSFSGLSGYKDFLEEFASFLKSKYLTDHALAELKERGTIKVPEDLVLEVCSGSIFVPENCSTIQDLDKLFLRVYAVKRGVFDLRNPVSRKDRLYFLTEYRSALS